MSKRHEFPAAVRREAWSRCGGRCETCHEELRKGDFQYDHDIPDAFGGPPTLDNCKVLCTRCHVAKQDWKAIAKSNRIRRKHHLDPDTRKQKPPMRSRGFQERTTPTSWPKRPFPQRRTT